MKRFREFTNLYPISKTLRFSLIPVGKTMEHIIASGLLEQDEHRANSYEKVKKIIDRYHKWYIENTLKNFRLKYTDKGHHDSLEEYYTFYMAGSKEETQQKLFDNIRENLRKQISERLTNNEQFKRIGKQQLIKEDLLHFVTSPEEKALVSEFKDFTTYFTGFHENRRNMYVADAKSTAIAYRLIHENLPKFIDNIQVFDKVATTIIADNFQTIYTHFAEYLNVCEINEMFRLDYFNTLLTQSQIDAYNAVIGGKVLEDGSKVQGLNEYINLYNQQQVDKHDRLPRFKPLFKQILSDRETLSWLSEEFDSDEKLLNAVRQYFEDTNKLLSNEPTEEEASLKQLLEKITDYNLQKIYICNDLQLTDISQKIFGDWSIIRQVFAEDFERNNPPKKRESKEKYEERKEKSLKACRVLSIAEIDEKLDLSGKPSEQRVRCHFSQLGKEENENGQSENLFDRIAKQYEETKDLLYTPYPKDKNLTQDKLNTEKIKNLLDAVKDLQYFVKPLLGKDTESDKDEKFYGEFIPMWEELDKITLLYNKVRNYLTRKPYSVEKIKLNFENSTLMDGWDVNKESDNTTVILRKGGLYYLAIMNKHHNQVFKPKNTPSSGDCYEKMVYKLLPGANKMLPKVFFSKSRINEFNPSASICENYDKGTHKKGPNFSLKDCHDLIDFFKASINKHEDWNKFGFHFSETESYQDLSNFYREVEQQGYKISFCKVSENYIHQLVDEGKIYLFKIYNKDFSPYSKGTPNMHTIYWKMLFDERNLKDVVFKLNGQAEVFFRKASLKYEHPTHPARIPITNKNSNAIKKESVFEYDLIKNKRYTVDHFQFHVPITLNFKSRGSNNINPIVNEYIRNTEDIHIIGIDRGERHLLYLTLIDSHGNIVEGQQFSLNQIGNTNYHTLLEKREDERTKARQSWQSIENIKELKEGYMSQVIHKIAEMMVTYNAIVVLEDLNMGFKRGRQKVEKQVYQKFEKMLIDKLNYLVDKKKDISESGGALHAYQLTNKFESFQQMGKQNGFLFYVPAWNTSKIDPVTGFVNLFDTRYESVEKVRAFFEKFDQIGYNAEKDWFEFAFDYDKFTLKAEGTRTQWVICTYGSRIETFRNPEKKQNWDSKEVNLTEEFKKLFQVYGITLGPNMKEDIVRRTEKPFFYNDSMDKDASMGLLQLFKLTLQMRNSIANSEIDYLISPVADESGHFFDSRVAGDKLPQNADANGAYNIARKGLWVVEQIKHCENPQKIRLAISNKEWLQFVQNKKQS